MITVPVITVTVTVVVTVTVTVTHCGVLLVGSSFKTFNMVSNARPINHDSMMDINSF